MSFSAEIKKELEHQNSLARHCQIAEIAAMIHFCSQIEQRIPGKICLNFTAENAFATRKCFTMMKKTFNIETLKDDDHFIINQEDIQEIFYGIKLIDSHGVLHDLKDRINPMLLKKTCCQRAFLRGVFLSIGSMSDPNKGYHLELVCNYLSHAKQIQEILRLFELDGKIIERKKYYVVYLKEGTNIVDFLNICEAHVALMEFENLRIIKEMRNSINRRVNCETANITKTVNAATKQIEDIIYIRDTMGFESLPDNLSEMASVRLEYPEATLLELGQYLDPPVGKSGVNHRLRKLSEIAKTNKL
ncbi:MAG: DNA-binding protein WhiA [Lachnospiraceae bacterium]